MIYSVFDMEADGLVENATKTHCLCYATYNTETGSKEVGSIVSHEKMIEWFKRQPILVGHNIMRYDRRLIQKLLNYDIKDNSFLIDTLGLSWYLYPLRDKHKLESWGEELGVSKPVVEDWENESLETYIYRCSEDVKINSLLFQKEVEYLKLIYGRDTDNINRIMAYLTFKLECAAEQEEVKWKLDVPFCTQKLEELKTLRDQAYEDLKAAMPEAIKYKVVKRPKVFYKKDGELSAAANRWLSYCLENDVEDSEELVELKVVAGKEPGNPGSHAQLKDWLFSLGWIPKTFKYVKKEVPGDEYTPMTQYTTRAIPQISLIDGSDICSSVKDLYEKAPALKSLEGFYVLKHRIGILEGFLRDRNNEDFLEAKVQGFTNTLRFQHTTIVNLPTVMKPYGDIIRGCLIASDDSMELCGSDMSGLEDNCKRHYMYPYDPEYVMEMMKPTFDPHLDIAVLAGLCSLEEANWYKWIKCDNESKLPLFEAEVTDEYKKLESQIADALKKTMAKVRDKAKKTNFSAVYGVGAKKLSLTSGLPIEECQALLIIYWKRNWAVKKIAAKSIYKTVNGQMWLYNPVSRFWYSLRNEKDIFSTLNQGTGVYCFDTWVYNTRQSPLPLKLKLTGQFHDEVIYCIPKGKREEVKYKLKKAIQDTNDALKLNIQLDISVDFGRSYAEIH